MPETFDPSSPTLAVTTVLDQSQDSHIDQLQRAAIGPVNADYYRPILSRFETYDRGSPSWNWAACLCTLNWMVFRGMWMPALAYLGGLMLAIATLFVVTRLAAPMAPSVEWGLWAAWATLVFLVPGLFGNTWLFGHYRLRLARALSATPTVVDACQMLGWQASSRRRLIHLAVANGAVALAIAAVWLWPGPPGQKSARVDQGEVRGAGKSAAIENAVTALPPARGAVSNTHPHRQHQRPCRLPPRHRRPPCRFLRRLRCRRSPLQAHRYPTSPTSGTRPLPRDHARRITNRQHPSPRQPDGTRRRRPQLRRPGQRPALRRRQSGAT